MAHDPVHDHIFGDRDEAAPDAPSVAPRRHVPFAGMFGAYEVIRDLDLPPPSSPRAYPQRRP